MERWKNWKYFQCFSAVSDWTGNKKSDFSRLLTNYRQLSEIKKAWYKFSTQREAKAKGND